MANCNAIKIRNTKKYKVPKASNLAHNSAMTKATYWLHDGDDLIQSQIYKNHRSINEDWNNWLKEANQRYINNKNNKRALRSDAVVIEEGMIIVGTDVKVTTNNLKNIIEDFIKNFEEENNTKVRHWSYHNHEGHIDENNKSEKINRHIHFLFDNVSNDGIMIRRAWKREYLEKLQDNIYNISKKYILDIERAKSSEYKVVNIEGREVKINTRKHIHHRKYRQLKELETQGNKNKQIEENLKQIKTNQDKNELAKQKDLKEEISRLRAELKENGAAREDYARLEQLNKDLKLKIKNKELIQNELIKEMDLLKKEFLIKDEKINILEEKNKIKLENIEIKNLDLNSLEEELEPISEELDNVINEHVETNTYSVKKGLLKYEDERINELKNVKSFKNKLLEYFKKQLTNLQKKYEILKDKFNKLKSENEELKTEVVKLKKENLNLANGENSYDNLSMFDKLSEKTNENLNRITNGKNNNQTTSTIQVINNQNNSTKKYKNK